MNIKELYNKKLEQYGESDFRSLNWGDKEGKSAKKRYEQMSQYVVAGNRGGPAWSPNLLKEYLYKMSLIAKKVIVNFPSNRATIRTEFVEYFSPEYVLGEALNITENVQLIHKQKSDFLLILNYE